LQLRYNTALCLTTTCMHFTRWRQYAERSKKMVRVGIIGMGGMGNMHFGVYEGLSDAEVVALADTEPERLKPGASSQEINVGAGGATIDPERHKTYTNPDDLLNDPDVDMVDICLPTFLHAEYCIKAIRAGKHVLCEKPMAASSKECQKILAALKKSNVLFMVAQCIRFWPEYAYLKETVESNRLGPMRSLSMWRGSATPQWSWQGWLTDHAKSGGAILDLHVHDADFVHYLLGKPKGVCSSGAIGPSGGYDVVETLYLYDEDMAVTAGANMGMPAGFQFEMRYTAAFERGCLVFSSSKSPSLIEITESGQTHPELKHTDGYHEEISYFLHCIQNNEAPAIATPESSAFSIKLIEAELKSIGSGKVVAL